MTDDITSKLNATRDSSDAWFEYKSASLAKATWISYDNSVNRFVIFCNTNYDKLLELDDDTIYKNVKSFVINQIKRGISKSACKNELAAIRLFLEMNERQNAVNWSKVKRRLPTDNRKKAGEVPYTNNDIDRMLDTTTKLRMIAIIHFFASTGCRPGAIYDEDGYLQLKHIAKMPLDCARITIYHDTKYEYVVFLTPEAYAALKAYFDWRTARGEVLTPESPVFSTFYKKKSGHLGPMAYDNIHKLMQAVILRAGIQRTKVNKQSFDKFLFYGFRKRWDTLAKSTSGINPNLIEKLMAHNSKTIALDSNYLKPTPEILFEEFKKIMSSLSISKEYILLTENLKLKEKIHSQTKDDVLKVFEAMDITMDDLKDFVDQRHKDRKYK